MFRVEISAFSGSEASGALRGVVPGFRVHVSLGNLGRSFDPLHGFSAAAQKNTP